MGAMELRHWLAFFYVGIIAGSSFMWNKLALQELQPAQMLIWRFGLGAATLAVFTLARRPALPRTAGDWVSPVIMGLFNIAVPHLLITWAQQRVDSTITGILHATTPLFTMLVAHVLLRDDRLSRGRLVGATVSFVGVVLVINRTGHGSFDGTLVGQLAILGASLSFGVSSVVAQRYRSTLSPLVLALLANAVACLTMLVAAPLFGIPPVIPQRPLSLAAVAFLGILQSAMGYMLFFYMLAAIGPSRTQMVGYVLPVVAVLLGVLLLGEPLLWPAVVGGLMIMVGIATANTARSRPASPPAAR